MTIKQEIMSAKEWGAILNEALPCPYCGSTNLAVKTWVIGNSDIVDAIECKECLSGASVRWHQRGTSEHDRPVDAKQDIPESASRSIRVKELTREYSELDKAIHRLMQANAELSQALARARRSLESHIDTGHHE